MYRRTGMQTHERIAMHLHADTTHVIKSISYHSSLKAWRRALDVFGGLKRRGLQVGTYTASLSLSLSLSLSPSLHYLLYACR